MGGPSQRMIKRLRPLKHILAKRLKFLFWARVYFRMRKAYFYECNAMNGSLSILVSLKRSIWLANDHITHQKLANFFSLFSINIVVVQHNYMIYWNFLTQVHCGTIALSDSLGTDYKIPKTANTFFTRHIKIYENFWYIKKFKNVLCHLWVNTVERLRECWQCGPLTVLRVAIIG